MPRIRINQKVLLLLAVVVLVLASFVAVSFAMSSAHAANAGGPVAKCTGGNPKCRVGGTGSQTKGAFTILDVNGNTIHARYVEPPENAGKAVTLIRTSSTTYQPDASIVAAGKKIDVLGTLNKDGSITVQVFVLDVPSVGGAITSSNDTTVTLQDKDRTSVVHLTASTTYAKIVPSNKQRLPASRSDLKVGVIISSQGALNADGSLTASSVTIAER